MTVNFYGIEAKQYILTLHTPRKEGKSLHCFSIQDYALAAIFVDVK